MRTPGLTLTLFTAVCAATASAPLPAEAQVPDPVCSKVPPVISLSPDGALEYRVELVQEPCGAPLVGAQVEIQFSPQADALVAWPVGQAHPVIAATSDGQGVASFFITGGGCICRSAFGPGYIARVWVDGVLLQEAEVNSPDVVNQDGDLPTTSGVNNCNGGISEVGLADATFHTVPVTLGLSELCSNFTGPDYTDPVSLGDAVIISGYIQLGPSFTCD